jgi:hypothetical protein
MIQTGKKDQHKINLVGSIGFETAIFLISLIVFLLFELALS